MAKVKICGLQSLEDIDIVNALLPDYAGFVFCESKRRVDIGSAAALCAALDGRIKKAGVFVNSERGFIEKAQQECGLDVLQLHGDEPPDDCVFDGCEVWKALRVKDRESLKEAREYSADRILFDAYDKGSYGGTGKAFNWELLRSYPEKARIVLAGGLSPDNVAAAVNAVNPYAADVSSGVETNGRKDFNKVKLFIERAGRERAL